MDTRGINAGMIVRSIDGEKLGKVVACKADEFVIEKGFFFPKDYLVRYQDVADVRDGEVMLRGSSAELRQAGEGWTEGATASKTTPAAPGGPMASGTREEVKVPVAEEELTAEKRMKQSGEVKVRKEVTTETKHVSVPVTKEEVHVERIPGSGEPAPGEATFQEGTVSVPVREEEVEVRKRPVIREEVRVSKTPRQEERRADAEVRKENVEVEREGDVERRGPIDEPEK